MYQVKNEEEGALIGNKVDSIIELVDGLTPRQVNIIINDIRYMLDNTPIKLQNGGDDWGKKVS